VSANLEVRIAGDRFRVVQGRQILLDMPVEEWMAALAGSVDRTPRWGTLPRGVRFLHERGDTVGVAIEVEPHCRTVSWLAADSKEPYGPRARYERYFLAFPYVVLLLVFHKHLITNFHQVFYRVASLDEGDELLLPNLLNVARGYAQPAWVCLQNLPPRTWNKTWAKKIDAIVEHVFVAAFNRSADEHEGNSHWADTRGIDARVGSIEAWQEASLKNPHFPLQVAWRPAKTTVPAELARMLDHVERRRSPRTAVDVAGLSMPRSPRRKRRP
jgi:hypothetical protein